MTSLKEAIVNINNQVKISDSNGRVTFDTLEEILNISISKEGYKVSDNWFGGHCFQAVEAGLCGCSMKMDTAISVKNVSKKFKLYKNPKDRLKEAFHPRRKKYHRDFWALQDISFDVPKGTTMGIIGQNGCGKSTLLQIICGILRASSGHVKQMAEYQHFLNLVQVLTLTLQDVKMFT